MDIKNFIQIAIALVLLTGACSKKTFERAETFSGRVSGDEKEIFSEIITEKYWKLIELNGKPVVLDESFKQEPFFILRNEERCLNGHGGCNTILGTFEIDPTAKRIKFSQMTTTMMMCLNMEFEDGMKKVFEMADNYSLSPDGKYLSLNRARMAPLARFAVVYLR